MDKEQFQGLMVVVWSILFALMWVGCATSNFALTGAMAVLSQIPAWTLVGMKAEREWFQ